MLCVNNNNNYQPNFKSTWYIVDRKVFNILVNKISHNEVLYPWTLKEGKIAKDVFTRDVFDCGVIGVTNGLNASMDHICPTEPKNLEFTKIKDSILEKIDLLRNEYLQGFVLGGKSNVAITKSPRSMEYVNGYCDIFRQADVPFSKFLAGDYWNDIAYFTEKDAFFIGNERADSLRKIFPDNPLAAAKEIFDEVELCVQDEIKWY